MGAYLSKPNCEKASEDFDGEFLRFGSSSMQGWRISQEDAHCNIVDFDSSSSTSLFAVYDGHGGSEVAEYTAENFPKFLKTVAAYTDGHMSAALEDAFLGFDVTLTSDDVKKQLTVLAGGNKDGTDEEEDEDEVKNETEMLCEEAKMPIEKLLERYGGAGCNRAIAAVKKQSAKHVLSPVIRHKPNNLSPIAESPCLTAGGDSASSETQGTIDVETKNNKNSEICMNLANKVLNGCSDEVISAEDAETEGKSSVGNTADENDLKCKLPVNELDSDGLDLKINDSKSVDAEVESKRYVDKPADEKDLKCKLLPVNELDSDGVDLKTSDSISVRIIADSVASSSECSIATTASVSSSCCSTSDGSTAEESATAGCSKPKAEDSDEETTDEEEDSDSDAEDAQWKEDGDSDDDDEDNEEGLVFCNDDDSDDDDDDEDEDDAEEVDEGMDFGEEPGADSGCTAVVALLRGNELYVANAGDSRCVLCRAGKAVEMSVDHKPEDEPEKDRILKAGGRVTEDGRVNGGLNLSRAIGDHIYKRNSAITDREQMITALPDVKSLTLDEEDQFMVLACDGIWNVMSSQDVVDFVKRRLESGITKLSAICEEMFDFCLAPDTTGDGTGCDNMTCVIVTFKGLTTSVAQRTCSKRKAAVTTDADDDISGNSPKRLKEDDN